MNEEQDSSKQARKSGSKHRRTLQRLLLILAVAMVIRRWVWMPAFIVGNSMLPTIQAGEIVGVNKLIYLFRPPRRGDVVAVWTGSELMIKRVVGLPGEEIAERDGVFCVDGVPLAEPYVQFRDHGKMDPGRVGLDRFVVAGDNRLQTLIAVVNRERIIGRLRPRGGPNRLPSLHNCLMREHGNPLTGSSLVLQSRSSHITRIFAIGDIFTVPDSMRGRKVGHLTTVTAPVGSCSVNRSRAKP